MGLDQVRDALAVRVGREYVALALELRSQLGEVLHDAVVYDGDLVPAVGVRVCVLVCRRAVGRPPRVAEAAGAAGEAVAHHARQRGQLAHRLPQLGLARWPDDDYARAVVTNGIRAGRARPSVWARRPWSRSTR